MVDLAANYPLFSGPATRYSTSEILVVLWILFSDHLLGSYHSNTVLSALFSTVGAICLRCGDDGFGGSFTVLAKKYP